MLLKGPAKGVFLVSEVPLGWGTLCNESTRTPVAPTQHLSGPGVKGYLAHKKPPPRRTLQQDYAQGLVVALGGGAVS